MTDKECIACIEMRNKEDNFLYWKLNCCKIDKVFVFFKKALSLSRILNDNFYGNHNIKV